MPALVSWMPMPSYAVIDHPPSPLPHPLPVRPDDRPHALSKCHMHAYMQACLHAGILTLLHASKQASMLVCLHIEQKVSWAGEGDAPPQPTSWNGGGGGGGG
jgi:hypothetical protein